MRWICTKNYSDSSDTDSDNQLNWSRQYHYLKASSLIIFHRIYFDEVLWSINIYVNHFWNDKKKADTHSKYTLHPKRINQQRQEYKALVKTMAVAASINMAQLTDYIWWRYLTTIEYLFDFHSLAHEYSNSINIETISNTFDFELITQLFPNEYSLFNSF